MTTARESNRLMSVLKRCLKTRGLTYRDLAEQMNLSESSIKRLFANNSLSMRRFEQICQILEMSIFDVSKMAREEFRADDPHSLTRKQEQALAENTNLLIGFHLLLNGWEFQQIVDAFTWSEPELIKILTRLDKLKLISLLPQNKVQILTAHNIRWRKDGAIRRRYQNLVLSEFLNDGFAAQDQLLDFEIVELSPASNTILQRKLEMLLKDINELAAMDYGITQSRKTSTAILVAIRPWIAGMAIDAMSDDYKKGKTITRH